MKRWEQFNEMLGTDDSLDVQTAEIFCNKLEEENAESYDKNDLYQTIRGWLSEEVAERKTA